MLTDKTLEYINRSVLCWLATADASGAPNVSPKEVFAVLGTDMMLVANIGSPASVRNIKTNPKVCVSFVDIFVQKGCKVLGTAEVVLPADPRYREMEAALYPIAQGAFQIHSIIAVHVTEVESIIAPSYRLVPGTTEQSQVASAMRTYGVAPGTGSSQS